MVCLKTKTFLNTYTVQFFYTFAQIFVFSILFLYLFKTGFSNLEIAVFSTLRFAAAALVLIFLKNVKFRRTITLGIIFKSLYLASFAYFIAGFEVLQLYATAIIVGIVLFIFWVPYNIRFFSFGNKENNAFMGSIIFLLWPCLMFFFRQQQAL